MSHNTAHQERCSQCRLPVALCFCGAIPKISNRHWLTLLIHARELRKVSNSGMLAHYALRQSDVIIRGEPGHSLQQQPLVKNGFYPVLLFPVPGAKILDQVFIEQLDRPLQLIVPDGNWRQASKAMKRIPELHTMRKVCLPWSGPSQYQLRKEPKKPEGLATLEAIALAFHILEGPECGTALSHLFSTMVRHNLVYRGKLPIHELDQSTSAKEIGR